MPFIGNQPALSYTSFAKQDFTTSATTSYTLDNPVTNENELALFINFVRQEPTTAYTASGTTLTLTSATSATDDMYCVFLGKAVQTVNPPSGSVGTAQLADSSVTSAKLASGAVSNTPAFAINLNAEQSISSSSFTKVNFDTEVFDTAGAYDNSTNYRFTVPSGQAGKYKFYFDLSAKSSSDDLTYIISALYKNGSLAKRSETNTNGISNAKFRVFQVIASAILDLSVGDYVEAYAYITGTSPVVQAQTGNRSYFEGYKIIGA